MENKEIIEKIINKKEFSQLPINDVKLAFSHFKKRKISEEEKIRLTRELLHKVYGAFVSRKLLNLRYRSPEWVLKKHISTRERVQYYNEIYDRLFKNFSGIIFDLGAGVNGFSYIYFKKKFKYIGIEAIGQFVKLMNLFFKKEKINGRAIHLSLFELEKIKKIVKNSRGRKIIILFKVIDSIEMMQKNYSKRLLLELTPLVEKLIISFSTESMGTRKKFNVTRRWIINFIQENFKILDCFEIKNERFVVFSSKSTS
ncbi:MAG: hypothetical protein QXD63_01670 [Candidatus Pacearchaeota archaeon]